MRKPKTMRGFLLAMLAVAEWVPSDFDGCDDLTNDEEMAVGEILAAIQNRLGDELQDVLNRHKLEYNG